MLFCVTSILERAGLHAVDTLLKKGFRQQPNQDGAMVEIMDSARWKMDLVVHLDRPEDWLQFYTRPFSVLIVVHPLLKEGDQIDFLQHNQYISGMLEVKKGFLNRTNLIEVREDRVEEVCNHRSRPTWQEYFMSIAQVAATRSNCMKRKVGAVIVKNNRVLSIGYNGTSTSTVNCCDGGCSRCNNNTHKGRELADCFCIHAEESAFLERNSADIRGSELYTTTYPCRLCSRKIAQLQISKVYYVHEYTCDPEIKHLFETNRIEVIKLSE
ncbi:dCMP deaminase [Nematocida major]|uniref:dCMP deaminase n=1 Tax=Nematocida major TaxID=1912982 RepID=UPI002008D061|nr:dCMP deaminase [Nematocida major]KAH9386723.1 dCMP deaminase [Nematocida major]